MPRDATALAALCDARRPPRRVSRRLGPRPCRRGLGGRAQPPGDGGRDHAQGPAVHARLARGGVLRDHRSADRSANRKEEQLMLALVLERVGQAAAALDAHLGPRRDALLQRDRDVLHLQARRQGRSSPGSMATGSASPSRSCRSRTASCTASSTSRRCSGSSRWRCSPARPRPSTASGRCATCSCASRRGSSCCAASSWRSRCSC